MRGARATTVGALGILAIALAVVPSTAGAETRQFVNTDQQFPSQGGELFGPSTRYPSTISVSGLSGSVTKATVTLFISGSGSPDDIDMAIVGPNGQAVMLMSDACGANPSTVDDATWTFDDDAPTFAPDNGPCPNQPQTYRPSNYEDPALDNLAVGGGPPPPPYLNALSFLAGGSPNGDWKLFTLDDNNAFVGFVLLGWALTLEIEPPGAADTTPPDTQIGKGPRKKSKKRRARFEFAASEPGSAFECSLDGAGFAACASPYELKVKRGKHKLEVRAVDAAGNADPSPAVWGWKVTRR